MSSCANSYGMTLETIDKKRKRMIFRSWHRGTREMDIIMGSFADKHIQSFDEQQLDTYDEILNIPDPDIYDWICQREQPPANTRSDVLTMLLSHDTSKR